MPQEPTAYLPLNVLQADSHAEAGGNDREHGNPFETSMIRAATVGFTGCFLASAGPDSWDWSAQRFEDIAGAVLYPASCRAEIMMGVNVEVDGGRTIWT